MRLGQYPCVIRPGTLAERVYGATEVMERHRHRFEFNPAYREQMEEAGFIVSATSPDGMLAEVVELRDIKFFGKFVYIISFHILEPWRLFIRISIISNMMLFLYLFL